MATVYTKTDNYGLNLYGDNDPADLRDGYNNSMRTIDTTLKTHLDRIEGMESENGDSRIKGFVPLSEMFGYATGLRSSTQGRGTFTMTFDHYEEVPKANSQQITEERLGNK